MYWSVESGFDCSARTLYLVEDEELVREMTQQAADEVITDLPIEDHPHVMAAEFFGCMQAPQLEEITIWGSNTEAVLESYDFQNALGSFSNLSRLTIGAGPHSASMLDICPSGKTDLTGLLLVTPGLGYLALHDDDIPHHTRLVSIKLLEDLTVSKGSLKLLPMLLELHLTYQRQWILPFWAREQEQLGESTVKMVKSRRSLGRGVVCLEELHLSVARRSSESKCPDEVLTVEDVLDEEWYEKLIDMDDDDFDIFTDELVDSPLLNAQEDEENW
jgi:hypothetical protein